MLINWNFDNSFLNLPKDFYSIVEAEKIPNPEIILYNKSLSSELNINIKNIKNSTMAEILTGQKKEEKDIYFSQAYAGHQFGYFTILGDGRALILGEHINKKNQRFDIQLKGSGKTPYSRQGDGKATLGSMLREYIVSESMNYLNIPSTRSLALVLTGENILREKLDPGAILIRVAQSHLRVGTFELALYKKNKKNIIDLANYSIDRHYPQLNNSSNKYQQFFEKVAERQLDLIINWMRVGFIHGVMNTDNMTITGETIDYGPCAFIDEYLSKKVFSSIDHMGRYSFENQPRIALWNLSRFAETILFLIDDDEKKAIKKAELILNKFQEDFHKKWLQMMKTKIGLIENDEKDKLLITDLLDIMEKNNLDYTNTFVNIQNGEFKNNDFLRNWEKNYKQRKKLEKKDNKFLNQLMIKNNPIIIPRNHIIEKFIKEAENYNYKNIKLFLDLMKKTYQNNNDTPDYFKQPPKDNEKVLQTFCGT